MNDDEKRAREGLVRWGKSLFDRGLTPGSSGNLSVRLADGYLFTPTNSCLGFLDADRLSKLDTAGQHVGGDPPTKELPLHFAFYESRPSARAVVHLHSTHATALSCLADTDPTTPSRRSRPMWSCASARCPSCLTPARARPMSPR